MPPSHRTSHRLVGLATAVVLTASSLGLAGVAPASAADHTDSADSADASGTFAPVAPTARPMPAGTPAGSPSARSTWPVGSRTATLARESGVTPSGAASQNLAAVTVAQKRAASTIQADIVLAAAPTLETDSRIRVAFGRVVDSGSGPLCTPTSTSVVDIHSFDVNGSGSSSNPAYAGKHIVIKPTRLALAKTAAWDCAFVLVLNADATVTYDAFIARLVDHVQKPSLSFAVKGKKLKRNGYTRVPITIRNSAATIATAPAVRLRWRTQGVSVRATARVGTIKPGHSRKGFFLVKDTRRGTGKITFTATSKNYRTSVTLKVRER